MSIRNYKTRMEASEAEWFDPLAHWTEFDLVEQMRQTGSGDTIASWDKAYAVLIKERANVVGAYRTLQDAQPPPPLPPGFENLHIRTRALQGRFETISINVRFDAARRKHAASGHTTSGPPLAEVLDDVRFTEMWQTEILIVRNMLNLYLAELSDAYAEGVRRRPALAPFEKMLVTDMEQLTQLLAGDAISGVLLSGIESGTKQVTKLVAQQLEARTEQPVSFMQRASNFLFGRRPPPSEGPAPELVRELEAYATERGVQQIKAKSDAVIDSLLADEPPRLATTLGLQDTKAAGVIDELGQFFAVARDMARETRELPRPGVELT